MVRLVGLSPESAWRQYRYHRERTGDETPTIIEDPEAGERRFESVLGVG